MSSVLLSSCSDENRGLITYIKQIKVRAPSPIEQMPSFAPLSAFNFPKDIKRRDPFKPANSEHNTANHTQNRHKMRLESYPLDALQFVGTLAQGSVIWALIKQPDKQIFPARVGDYMGLHSGRILLIENNQLHIEEVIKKSGKWKKQTTIISLKSGH